MALFKKSGIFSWTRITRKTVRSYWTNAFSFSLSSFLCWRAHLRHIELQRTVAMATFPLMFWLLFLALPSPACLSSTPPKIQSCSSQCLWSSQCQGQWAEDGQKAFLNNTFQFYKTLELQVVGKLVWRVLVCFSWEFRSDQPSSPFLGCVSGHWAYPEVATQQWQTPSVSKSDLCSVHVFSFSGNCHWW